MQPIVFVTNSSEETEALGERLGRILEPPALLLLRGDLGAGKTCFVRGLARGLGVPADEPVTSPTYALMHHYKGRYDLFHFDLYRLSSRHDLEEIGFNETISSGKIAVVEWSERTDGSDLEGIEVSFSFQDEDRRLITLSAKTEQDMRGLNRLLG